MEQELGNATVAISLKTALMFGFYIMSAAYIIFTIVMYYHWNEYSVNARVTSITLITYLVTTVPLIATLGIIALSF
ncbi:MAG: hypothetical protein UW75_C0009G0004 [Parcubacteria group bacterium GW2011_GWF2_44_8]|nr:MAG: hypothetical protein UW75_C0009G0004 [Parcubacteria group bacterium GW2011_GWF2_44_8]